MKAVIEFPVPVSCADCQIAFLYTDVNGNDTIGCGYLNEGVEEYEDCRAPDCPLIITED